MNDLIEHHIKYKEIHGYDETVWMTRSEHKLLHLRLRKEGQCNVPVDRLAEISMKANRRTEKYRKYASEYSKQNVSRFNLVKTMAPNIVLHEVIKCNRATGNVSYSAGFRGKNGYKLPVVDI